MTAIRVARRRRFTSIDRRAINDAQLSFRARGVLAWLLDKPDDWRTTADTIAAAGKEGRDAVRAALHELEATGYLTRRQWRTDDGKWASEWTVFELPNTTEPDDTPGRETSDGAGSGNQRRVTSAGQPHRETRPLTEELKLKTELPNDVFEDTANANPECARCGGGGTYWSAGAGSVIACPCTHATDVELDELSEPATAPPWLQLGMTVGEWSALGRPMPEVSAGKRANLEAVGS